MRKLNDFVYIKDESLIYVHGKYKVPKDLPAGEYYIWGTNVYYEYFRDTINYTYRNKREGYAVFEKKDKVNIESGMMTPIDNIGYVNENVERLYPNHVYRTGLEILTGFYLFKYDKKYFVEEETFLEKDECGIDMYRANSDSRRTREKGKYGCVEIVEEKKHIVVLNGIAMYYGQSKFDEFQELETAIVDENRLYEMGKSIICNEIIDLRLFFRYRKGGRFSGKITMDVLKYDWYIINGQCKWRAKVIPFLGQALNRLVIKFETTDGIKDIRVISGFPNIRHVYNDKIYRECYEISTEIPEHFYGKELQLTLLAYNECEVNEELEDYKSVENYLGESEIREYYREDYELLKNVLNKIEGINVEQELKSFDKIPDMIHLILPTLNEIADAKQNFACTKECLEEEMIFVIKATYNKAFYCIAKLADQAKDVCVQNNGNEFMIIYDCSQIECIKMTYYILEHEAFGYVNEPIKEFLQKNCCEYYVIQKVNECIARLYQEYGYTNLYRNSILQHIINSENKKIRRQVDKVYSDIVKEKRVPTRWGNEYRLFSLINSYNFNAQYQYHCEWLGQQSLDIYIPDSRIGIEYQGEQHYKAIDIWGGEAGLKENQERDLRKKKLCAENGVVLLEWSYQVVVNSENVIQFMKDNDIPFVKNESNVQIRTEMAPIIETEKKVKKRKAEVKNIKCYIVQYDLDGYYVNKYNDIGSAAEAVGVSATSISKVLRGQRNSAAGFVWRKVDANENIVEYIEIEFDIEKTNSGKAKKIALLDYNGKVIQEFESIVEAARKTKTTTDHIQKELAKSVSNEWKVCDQ